MEQECVHINYEIQVCQPWLGASSLKCITDALLQHVSAFFKADEEKVTMYLSEFDSGYRETSDTISNRLSMIWIWTLLALELPSFVT